MLIQFRDISQWKSTKNPKWVGPIGQNLDQIRRIKNVHKLISNIALLLKGDAKKFYPAFYKCISDLENLFDGSLN